MAKNRISPFHVVFEGLKVYLANLDVFCKYLTFPIVGMFIGMFILFAINYFYIINLDKIRALNPILDNEPVILTILLIITIPAFLIMMKAFIDYMVAMGAVNSMCVLGAKRITAVREHNEVVKMRFFPYCVLLLVLSVIYCIIPLLPLSLVFLCLAIQVFVLEEDASPYEAIRKSIETVKNNFGLILFSLLFIAAISYYLIPYLVSWFVGKTPAFAYLTMPVERYLGLLPIVDINALLAASGVKYVFDVTIIAENIVYGVVATIISMYMMPFRAACCVYLYKNFINSSKVEEVEGVEKYTKKSKKGRKKED